MPRVKTFLGLLAFISSLTLAFLGVFAIGRIGVVRRMFGDYRADTYIYPFLYSVVQWLPYLAMAVIAGLAVWGIVSYVRNRGKPEGQSAELKAINELKESIRVEPRVRRVRKHGRHR